jgi:hypothetical protein
LDFLFAFTGFPLIALPSQAFEATKMDSELSNGDSAPVPNTATVRVDGVLHLPGLVMTSGNMEQLSAMPTRKRKRQGKKEPKNWSDAGDDADGVVDGDGDDDGDGVVDGDNDGVIDGDADGDAKSVVDGDADGDAEDVVDADADGNDVNYTDGSSDDGSDYSPRDQPVRKARKLFHHSTLVLHRAKVDQEEKKPVSSIRFNVISLSD